VSPGKSRDVKAGKKEKNSARSRNETRRRKLRAMEWTVSSYWGEGKRLRAKGDGENHTGRTKACRLRAVGKERGGLSRHPNELFFSGGDRNGQAKNEPNYLSRKEGGRGRGAATFLPGRLLGPDPEIEEGS